MCKVYNSREESRCRPITLDDIKRERLKKTGVWDGMPYYVAEDFDEPLKDFAEYM